MITIQNWNSSEYVGWFMKYTSHWRGQKSSVLEGLTAYSILATPFSKYHTSDTKCRSICKKACTLVRLCC